MLTSQLQPAIFDDIAQEAINFCRQSLVTAADALKAKNPSLTLDSQLFLARHILILKEMTQNLDFASAIKDTDVGDRIDVGGVAGMFALLMLFFGAS